MSEEEVYGMVDLEAASVDTGKMQRDVDVATPSPDKSAFGDMVKGLRKSAEDMQEKIPHHRDLQEVVYHLEEMGKYEEGFDDFFMSLFPSTTLHRISPEEEKMAVELANDGWIGRSQEIDLAIECLENSYKFVNDGETHVKNSGEGLFTKHKENGRWTDQKKISEETLREISSIRSGEDDDEKVTVIVSDMGIEGKLSISEDKLP